MPELKSLLALLVITVIGAGATLYIKNQIYTLPEIDDSVVMATGSPATVSTTTDEITNPETESPVVVNPTPAPGNPPQGIAPSLTGTITAVNTGCFSDGECSVTVAGQKVVLLVGWYQGKVGKIIGAENIGDLENYIGATATVFAGKNDAGDYTLLGNEMFYIQVSSTTKPVAAACMVGGCSAQLCGEATEMEGMVTTCEYRESYACYKQTKCERQTTGKCGWTETPELQACLKDA